MQKKVLVILVILSIAFLVSGHRGNFWKHGDKFFKKAENIWKNFDGTVDNFFKRGDKFFRRGFGMRRRCRYHHLLDALESEKDYILIIDLPGVKKENITVDVKTVNERDVITITALRERPKYPSGIQVLLEEREYGKFKRKWVFERRVKKEEIFAKYENGVLMITVPKVPPTKEDEKTVSVTIM